MANLLLLAPQAGMAFASLPSGSTYIADANGLVVISNGSLADEIALVAAGCAVLLPLSVGVTQQTLAGLYAADVATPYAQGTFAIVYADGTTANDGLWQKTGTGNGSGNWTQLASYTVASLQSQVNTNTTAIANETTRAEAAETVLTGNVATLLTEMATANSQIATNTGAIASETARAESAEAVLTANLANETTRAEGAEASLGTSVSTLQRELAGAAINGAFCTGGTPPGTVDVATTGTLPNFFYNPQASGDQIVFTGVLPLSTVDGVTVSVGTRLLVKNQSGTGAQGAYTNGLYQMTQQGDGVAVPVVLSRVADAYTASQLAGIKCLVNGGSANGQTIWLLPLNAGAIAVGTTQLLFSQVANGLGQLTTQAASSYTLQPGDNNSTIVFSSAAAVAVTLPNSLPVGFRAKLVQGGTGQVSVSAASGATLDTPNQASTPGQYATLDVLVTANAGGVAAVWDAVASAPPNVASVLVTKSANYTALGSEGFIEANAAGGALVLTVSPSVVNGRSPIRVRKIDATANAVSITDGVNTILALVTPANANGALGGWADVSSNGTHLRCEGAP